MAAEALEKSVLEGKDREQLMAIAQALGVKSVSRAKKAELIEKILEQQSLAQKLGAATGAVFRRPSSVKDMWNLRERALVASDRLAKFLTQLIPQIVRENPERSAP